MVEDFIVVGGSVIGALIGHVLMMRYKITERLWVRIQRASMMHCGLSYEEACDFIPDIK